MWQANLTVQASRQYDNNDNEIYLDWNTFLKIRLTSLNFVFLCLQHQLAMRFHEAGEPYAQFYEQKLRKVG